MNTENKIKNEFEKSNLSQVDFAKKIGQHRSAVLRWLNGSPVQKSKRREVCAALGKPSDWLDDARPESVEEPAGAYGSSAKLDALRDKLAIAAKDVRIAEKTAEVAELRLRAAADALRRLIHTCAHSGDDEAAETAALHSLVDALGIPREEIDPLVRRIRPRTPGARRAI